jgi:hypothetical protein
MAKEKNETAPREPESNVQSNPATGAPPSQQAIKVDTTSLKSSYCNVVSGNSTREEVVLTFGVNQDWDMGPRPQEIQLHHRIILSPGAAKRLLDLVTKLVRDHETRYGELK